MDFFKKKHVLKNIFYNLNAAKYLFKVIIVPYAFPGCNLRVGKFYVSASNLIIFFGVNIFLQAHLMDSGNA